MKLIFCKECSDVRALSKLSVTFCGCGNSFGTYLDNSNAVIGGEAYLIGILNINLSIGISSVDEGGFSPLAAYMQPVGMDKNVVRLDSAEEITELIADVQAKNSSRAKT